MTSLNVKQFAHFWTSSNYIKWRFKRFIFKVERHLIKNLEIPPKTPERSFTAKDFLQAIARAIDASSSEKRFTTGKSGKCRRRPHSRHKRPPGFYCRRILLWSSLRSIRYKCEIRVISTSGRHTGGGLGGGPDSINLGPRRQCQNSGIELQL